MTVAQLYNAGNIYRYCKFSEYSNVNDVNEQGSGLGTLSVKIMKPSNTIITSLALWCAPALIYAFSTQAWSQTGRDDVTLLVLKALVEARFSVSHAISTLSHSRRMAIIRHRPLMRRETSTSSRQQQTRATNTWYCSHQLVRRSAAACRDAVSYPQCVRRSARRLLPKRRSKPTRPSAAGYSCV